MTAAGLLTIATSAYDIAIRDLINERCATLGINRRILADRLGYRNTPKGIRRIGELSDGNLANVADLIPKLHVALEVVPEIVSQAIRDTSNQISERERQDNLEAARRWRESFRPHAIIVTEHLVPTQVTICAMVRGEQALRINLDDTQPRSTFRKQAFSELNRRLAQTGGVIPFFGKVTGLAINLTPDLAVRYDGDGRAVGIVGRAFRTGRRQAWVGRKLISSNHGWLCDLNGATGATLT